MRALQAGLRRLRALPQVAQFVLVGGAAAATHLLAVAAWVGWGGLAPLEANGLAFLLAFCVSYGGHAALTFASAHAWRWGAAGRYFLVACASFAANEALYALALHWLHWHYLWSLLAVLLLVAAGTFVLSKFWAFRAPRHA